MAVSNIAQRSVVVVDPQKEYGIFLHPAFDPNAYAHSIVNNEEYSLTTDDGTILSAGNADASATSALAKLNHSLDDITRQIRQEVSTHHVELIRHVSGLGTVQESVDDVRKSLIEVEGGVARLSKKIAVPYDELNAALALLFRLRRMAALVRRAARFTALCRRLQTQLDELDTHRERAMGEAALTLAELAGLIAPVKARPAELELPRARAQGGPPSIAALRAADAGTSPSPTATAPPSTAPTAATGAPSAPEDSLLAVTQITQHIPFIEQARARVDTLMRDMLHDGLNALDATRLASSLQTAHNLGILPRVVETLISSLSDTVGRLIRTCFDMQALAKQANAQQPSNSSFIYKSARLEPTAASLPLWNQLWWQRVDVFFNDLGSVCAKVYSLENVLKLRKDATTHVTFLEEALTLLDNEPTRIFWTTLSQRLGAQATEAARGSQFLQTTLASSYTRLLRHVHEFFARISVYTDTVYTVTHQSPETLLTLGALAPLEALYLRRCATRLTDVTAAAFASASALSKKLSGTPAADDGAALARTIVNELDTARFDPLLLKAVTASVSRALQQFQARCENLVVKDHSAVALTGPKATLSQRTNASIASALYQAAHVLIVSPFSLETDPLKTSYMAIATPLIYAIRRDLSAVINRMHEQDYAGSSANGDSRGADGADTYMALLLGKLTFIKDEILSTYKIGSLASEWVLDFARFVVQTFILHLSVVKPISESGKLQLVSELTSLEFGLSQFLSAYRLSLESVGGPFKVLRALKHLLFLETNQLTDSTQTKDLPALIVAHHIIVRNGNIPLPHEHHGWTPAEYVRWLNEHNEDQRMELIYNVLKEFHTDDVPTQDVVAQVRLVLDREKTEA